MKRRMLWGTTIAAATALLLGAPAAARAATPQVSVIEIRGAVDPLMARYVSRSIRGAVSRGDAAILIEIDTPGGLDSSMRDIVKSIRASSLPTVCWVGPSGARAASAGALILLSCPDAAMAPGTNVGAAHPVGFRGEVLDEKITNDVAAFARSLAETHNRNADLAERMVRASVSVSAQEAARRGIIDAIARTEREAIASLQAATVTTRGLALDGARLVRPRMSFVEAALHDAVDPNLAFLLFVLGIAGIIFEVLHPGISLPGILGGLSFLSSLVILGMLPVNLAGVALILIGIALFVVEAHAPGFGAPAALGFASLLLGGLFLFDSRVPGAQVSKALVIAVALLVGALFAFVVRAVMRARRQAPVAAQTLDLVGEQGMVTKALAPVGIVRARRDSWTARAAGDAPVPEGTPVMIVGVEGLTLVVEPAHSLSEGGTK